MLGGFLRNIFYILYSIVLLIVTPIRNYIYNPIVNRLDLIGASRDNGIITIKPEKITYKHDDIEETEIKSRNRNSRRGYRSIQLPQETIQTLFGGDEMGALSFKYLVKEKVFMRSNNNIRGGVLLTGRFASFEIGEDWFFWLLNRLNNNTINLLPPIKPVININSNQRDSVCAAIGVEANDALIENHGSMNIRTDYILFIANRIYSRNGGAVRDSGATLLKNGISSDISDLDADFVVITDNLINSATSFAHLIRNSKKIKIGKTGAKIVNISNNEVKGDMNVILIDGTVNDDSIIEIDGKYISMISNTIVSNGVYAFLLKSSQMTRIGTPETVVVDISDNIVEGESITSLIGVDSKSILNISSNSIYIRTNLAHSSMENSNKVNINLYGTNPYFELSNNRIPENYEGLGGIVMMNNSQLNFINHSGTMATIIIGDDIWSYYVDGDCTLTFEGIEDNKDKFVKIAKGLGLNKGNVGIGEDENIFFDTSTIIGSGFSGVFPIRFPNKHMNDNNNYMFSHTNNNNDNNNNNENEEIDEDGSDLFLVLLKNKDVKISKIEIKANTTVSMENGKFIARGRNPTLNVPEGKRLTVRSDGSCNSIRDCISGFTMSDETMSRIRFYRQEMDYDED